MFCLETDRTLLRHATLEDAAFILELLNEPDWIKYIGDRNVHDLDAARGYITDKLIASYTQNGFGSYLITLRDSGTPIGLCGLVKRDSLDCPDIGFALSAAHGGKGYALEAATAVMAHARHDLGLARVVGFALPENHGSIRLLERLGLVFDRMIHIDGDRDACKLFVPAP
ncbi:GNAT family N-acetyltransferase [Thalassospira sp.]|uniref:GNAT family N-acetyltransferase n=1 Tax=Thalassospira sp. TaxID=1912094 RepID=UPI002735032D|nr:GNAT family N-acetyltransferase [Thalassospira sp.]MDP2697697.1 GNAT family N-acetyltransferase [Thalassospira sp.]